jgi:hypothetical protein
MKGRKSKVEWSGPNNRRGIGRLLVALRVIRRDAKFGRYLVHSGHCSALAHIANFGIFPAQSLKQGTKCRNSTTSDPA